MSRENAIAQAEAIFDDGFFFDLLSRWVSYPTESQNEACRDALRNYLTGEITPYLENLGFGCRLVDNPGNPRLPALISRRMEGADLPTVLTYGHGDTVLAMDGRWREGLEPWLVIQENDRWYGRGTADNKGQHAPTNIFWPPLSRKACESWPGFSGIWRKGRRIIARPEITTGLPREFVTISNR